ncbi:unnamed protein product [Nezara viridula]|uniref:Metallo-beta-lactamase domain-containing protein 1 n=1 Tax=Nezara viridula TaxID=85310 RepID=A0A9P0HQE0_NEZVI|nr:unnamed protein product [Nezara viridula]
MAYEVLIIHNGYSKVVEGGMEANCTCTLIKGKYNVIVDTMTPWDSELILKGLEKYGVQPNDIHFIVSTHGHSDHIGNNNLFLNSTHIVGHSISKKNLYFDDPFSEGNPYYIDGDDLKIIATPGHTQTDVTVMVKTADGIVAVAGDLFEKKEDLENEFIWLSAGSECPVLQKYNRRMILQLADYIVPGHGEMFKVTEEIKNKCFVQK